MAKENDANAGSKRKRGRPTKYSPQVVERIIAGIAGCYTIERVCQLAGIGMPTFFEWLKRYPDFREAIDEARIKSQPILEQKIASNPDWKSAAWLLTRLNPAKWADPTATGPVTISLEGILNVIAARTGGARPPGIGMAAQPLGLLSPIAGHQDQVGSVGAVPVESIPGIPAQSPGGSTEAHGDGAGGDPEGPATGDLDIRSSEVLLADILKAGAKGLHLDAPTGSVGEPIRDGGTVPRKLPDEAAPGGVQ